MNVEEESRSLLRWDCLAARVLEGAALTPEEGLAMLRFHSFYAWHKHGAYQHLMNQKDQAMLPWVQKFNPYDLYSKGHTKPNLKELKPFYDDLFAEFFPGKLAW